MKKFRTDWLASRPVFYNEKTLKISHNVNDVIDFEDIEIHSEGFNNYLNFGYSVFGQTPVKNVKFLRHSSEIFVENNKIKIIEHPDPVEKWFSEKTEYSDENEVMELIKQKIQNYEKETKGLIIIPTSGGFDSRLLNYFIKDKSRIRAFTYGISKKQGDSFEAVYAKKLCEILDINWKRIELGNFHKYFDEWDELFGISTHAHGMYHIEFYKQILQDKNLEGANFISGIFGDAWAGSIKFKKIYSLLELNFLGYTHGLNADVNKSKLDCDYRYRKEFYEKEKINDYRYQIINIIRLKILLISYLLSVPEHYGFKVWSPYLDMDVALGMINLPPERRRNRQWQIDFFRKNGIYIEDLGLRMTKKNSLNYEAMKTIPLESLDKNLLSMIVDEKYVDWINNNVQNTNLMILKEFLFSQDTQDSFFLN